jgi:hypothetical protein
MFRKSNGASQYLSSTYVLWHLNISLDVRIPSQLCRCLLIFRKIKEEVEIRDRKNLYDDWSNCNLSRDLLDSVSSLHDCFHCLDHYWLLRAQIRALQAMCNLVLLLRRLQISIVACFSAIFSSFIGQAPCSIFLFTSRFRAHKHYTAIASNGLAKMSYDHLTNYQHARGSGRRRDPGNGALERLEKYICEELWSCCKCQHSMTITEITIPVCLECGHLRCPDCSMDWVKQRKTREDSIDSGSIYSSSAGRGNGGARNFASHDSDFGDSAMGNSALLDCSTEPNPCASPASIGSGIGSVPCSLDDKLRLKDEPRGLIHDICARRGETKAR